MSEAGASIYDRATAIARLDGDESLFTEMVDMFDAECENYCQALESALASGDAAELRREAHTVKSLFATFSCESGRLASLQLEQLAANGQQDGTAALTAQVVAMARQLARVLGNGVS